MRREVRQKHLKLKTMLLLFYGLSRNSQLISEVKRRCPRRNRVAILIKDDVLLLIFFL